MARQESDFYQRLRAKIRSWLRKGGRKHKYAEYIMLAPDLFHLLCKLTIDKKVPAKEKAKLAIVIAYFVSPLDLFPEGLIGPGGYVDDIALSAYVLSSIIRNAGEGVVKKHWAGEEDIIELIEHILEIANEIVGIGLWKKLKNLLK